MGEELLDAQSFFRVMVPGFRKKLLIPETFCALLKREIEVSEEAFLRTAKGQWTVRYRKGKDGKFYFLQGWENFVNHHGLKRGDFAIFEHKGNMSFDVDLFDHTACEKEYRREESTSPRKSIDSRNIINLPVPSTQYEDPLEAAKAYASTEPHFIVEMSKCHAQSYMNIPVDFARSNGLVTSGGGTINSTMRIPSGKEWQVRIRTRLRSGRHRVTLERGWCDFYVFNKLKNGDVCIFELNAGKVLNVVIFAVSN